MVALQGWTSNIHCNITASGTLPRAFSGGVASAARELGIQQDDFQQSTTGISTNDGVWFSWRVRQWQEEHGISRAFGSSTCSAAVASAGWQRGQKLSNTTTFDSRHSRAGHAGASPSAGCSRCPLQPDGRAVLHATGTPICEAACVCAVCGSDRHLEHGCFIAHGVPVNVKMRAAKVMELVRLHGVYVAGAFNWRTTPTSLPWILRLRGTLAAAADPNMRHNPDLNPNAGGAGFGYTSDDFEELCEANGCSEGLVTDRFHGYTSDDFEELCEANGCSEGLVTDGLSGFGYTSDDCEELCEANGCSEGLVTDGLHGYTSDDFEELCEANGCSEGLCTEAEFQAKVQAQAQAQAQAQLQAQAQDQAQAQASDEDGDVGHLSALEGDAQLDAESPAEAARIRHLDAEAARIGRPPGWYPTPAQAQARWEARSPSFGYVRGRGWVPVRARGRTRAEAHVRGRGWVPVARGQARAKAGGVPG